MKNAKDVLLFAAINCSHHIDSEKITLEFYPGKPGENALNQLSARLEVAFDACTASMTARIAELESQLATEVERLDFVIKEFAFVEHSAAGSQLKAVCEFDEQVSISGNSLHPTPRAAIDAARELAKGGV